MLCVSLQKCSFAGGDNDAAAAVAAAAGDDDEAWFCFGDMLHPSTKPSAQVPPLHGHL